MSQGSSGFHPPLEKCVSWFHADPWVLGNSGECWKVLILEVTAAKGIAVLENFTSLFSLRSKMWSETLRWLFWYLYLTILMLKVSVVVDECWRTWWIVQKMQSVNIVWPSTKNRISLGVSQYICMCERDTNLKVLIKIFIVRWYIKLHIIYRRLSSSYRLSKPASSL